MLPTPAEPRKTAPGIIRSMRCRRRRIRQTITVRLHGGDTLIIGAGSYQIGINAPGANAYSACNAGWVMGLRGWLRSERHERRADADLGAGWDTGCAAPPQAWAATRATEIVSAAGSSNVVVGCLDITDHATCIESHLGGSSPYACNRSSAPYGDWVSNRHPGQGFEQCNAAGSQDPWPREHRILAGRLSNWTVNRVFVIAERLGRWSNDLGEAAGSSMGQYGVHDIRSWLQRCGESWPGKQVFGCWPDGRRLRDGSARP